MAIRKVRRDDLGLCLIFGYRAYAPDNTSIKNGDWVCISHDDPYDQYIKVRLNPNSEDFEEWKISMDMDVRKAQDRDELAAIYGYEILDEESDETSQ